MNAVGVASAQESRLAESVSTVQGRSARGAFGDGGVCTLALHLVSTSGVPQWCLLDVVQSGEADARVADPHRPLGLLLRDVVVAPAELRGLAEEQAEQALRRQPDAGFFGQLADRSLTVVLALVQPATDAEPEQPIGGGGSKPFERPQFKPDPSSRFVIVEGSACGHFPAPLEGRIWHCRLATPAP